MAAMSIALCPPRSQSRTVSDRHARPEPSPTDADLVELAKNGDKEAFAQLIARYNSFCMSKAYSILRNRSEAEEEVQISWTKAWICLSSYRHEGSFMAWISRIVSNECLMSLRRAKLAKFSSIDDIFDVQDPFRLEVIDQQPSPEEMVGATEVSDVLNNEIRGIPPLLRRVLIMRDVRHLVLGEIADELGITVPAAKSRLMRARAELKRRMTKHLGTSGCATLLHKARRQRAVYVRAT